MIRFVKTLDFRMKFACSLGVIVAVLVFPLKSMALTTEAPPGGLSVVVLGTFASGTYNTGGLPNGAYFDTKEVPAVSRPGGCPYNLYYVDLSSTGGRAIYATLLTVKMSTGKLGRVDWERASGSPGLCFAVLVQPY